MKLNNASLSEIPIAKPSYDRSEISVGIVHFGVGGFHRAHQAMYVDRLLETGKAKEWGICGVGVLPGDRKMADVMAAQDGLYTLILDEPRRHPRRPGHRLDRRLPVSRPTTPRRVIELIAAPTTRIVSLTITEGGYDIDDAGPDSVFGLVDRGARPAPGTRHPVADDRVLRQHRGQRRRRPRRRSPPTPSGRTPAWPSG